MWNLALQSLKTYLHHHNVSGHQNWQVLTYHKGVLLIKSYDPLIMWSCQITRQTKTIISPQPHCIWSQNVGGWWLPLMNSHNPLNMWGHVTNSELFISAITMSVVTKLVRVVTNCEELPLINSHDLSMRWSFEATRQIEWITFSFVEDPGTPNQASCWLTMGGSQS